MTFLMLEDNSGSYELEDGSGGTLLETGGPYVTVTTIQDGGPTQNEIQQITVVATGGTWLVTWFPISDPQQIPPLDPRFAWDVSAAAIQAEFESYFGLTGVVSVSKVGNVYTFEFTGDFGLFDLEQMTADGSNLT